MCVSICEDAQMGIVKLWGRKKSSLSSQAQASLASASLRWTKNVRGGALVLAVRLIIRIRHDKAPFWWHATTFLTTRTTATKLPISLNLAFAAIMIQS